MRKFVLLSFVLMVVSILLYAQTHTSDASPTEPRYQLITATVQASGETTTFDVRTTFMVDTQSGHVWQYIGDRMMAPKPGEPKRWVPPYFLEIGVEGLHGFSVSK